MSRIYAVYGASGFGREVMPLVNKQLLDTYDRVVFIDDVLAETVQNGYEVLSFEQFCALKINNKNICLAIADSRIRRVLFDKIEENSIKHWSIFADNSVILDECEVGDNAVLAPFVTLTSNIVIGKSFHANIYSYVGHDCEIGDFVTFAPSVKCNGNVKIGNNVYIGTGAMIKPGKPGKPLIIGEDAIIGMGAIVTKDVPQGAMVIATPSKPMLRKGFGK